MSVYYEAASILTATFSNGAAEHQRGGSLKSLIYANHNNKNATTYKSKPAHLYALISETKKYDTFLKEVVDKSGILGLESKLTPTLSLLLAHDHFFAKNGVAATPTHHLRQCIEKHKARLQSEFTRARLRRRAANVEQLKKVLLAENGSAVKSSPRWVRVNTLKTTVEDFLNALPGPYRSVDSIKEVLEADVDVDLNQNVVYLDQNIPGLLAFGPNKELTSTPSYMKGDIILQDKASCFPAYMLLGDSGPNDTTDVFDGCAAPGNKTTHAAAIVAEKSLHSKVYACERDPTRSKTLQMMVDKAGAGKSVVVLQKQDFLALDPADGRFANVTHLLLDPSCSGSGILGREDVPKLNLPDDPRQSLSAQQSNQQSTSKKRKRGPQSKAAHESSESDVAREPEDPEIGSSQSTTAIDKVRLQKLSTLQSLIVEHAFRFPAAKKITYSTCSIHTEENEAVVERVLRSTSGTSRGWRVLRRDEQVDGMKAWTHRGYRPGTNDEQTSHGLTEEQIQACIRCYPHDEQGTMGFFLCGFVRDEYDKDVDVNESKKKKKKTASNGNTNSNSGHGMSSNIAVATIAAATAAAVDDVIDVEDETNGTDIDNEDENEVDDEDGGGDGDEWEGFSDR